MKELEGKIKNLKSIALLAEKAYVISMDESLDEDTTDAAYNEYWKHLNDIAMVIIDLIKVDEKTALRMAAHKRDEIVALVSRMAA